MTPESFVSLRHFETEAIVQPSFISQTTDGTAFQTVFKMSARWLRKPAGVRVRLEFRPREFEVFLPFPLPVLSPNGGMLEWKPSTKLRFQFPPIILSQTTGSGDSGETRGAASDVTLEGNFRPITDETVHFLRSSLYISSGVSCCLKRRIDGISASVCIPRC